MSTILLDDVRDGEDFVTYTLDKNERERVGGLVYNREGAVGIHVEHDSVTYEGKCVKFSSLIEKWI